MKKTQLNLSSLIHNLFCEYFKNSEGTFNADFCFKKIISVLIFLKPVQKNL
jgi:hypothetical protein